MYDVNVWAPDSLSMSGHFRPHQLTHRGFVSETLGRVNGNSAMSEGEMHLEISFKSYIERFYQLTGIKTNNSVIIYCFQMTKIKFC